MNQFNSVDRRYPFQGLLDTTSLGRGCPPKIHMDVRHHSIRTPGSIECRHIDSGHGHDIADIPCQARTIECFYKNDTIWLGFHHLPFNLDKLHFFRKLRAIPFMNSNNIVIPPVSNYIVTPYGNTTARKRPLCASLFSSSMTRGSEVSSPSACNSLSSNARPRSTISSRR